MAEKGYGEIKARAKIFPSDIDKFSEQGVSMILSILVDTFISKISLPMQPVPEIRSISGA
ncbi:hypothetical protein ACTQ50_19815 [Blautia sp. Sow4_E7]|uniref:hypothetical protein n=1 Tax=Blautia sp. Sow4_E7 TaxID=3438749 RepID=UPI003F8D932F